MSRYWSGLGRALIIGVLLTGQHNALSTQIALQGEVSELDELQRQDNKILEELRRRLNNDVSNTGEHEQWYHQLRLTIDAQRKSAQQLQSAIVNNQRQLEGISKHGVEPAMWDLLIKSSVARFANAISSSYVSVQYPERFELIEDFLSQSRIGSTADYKQLWREMLLEVMEAGEVRRFSTVVTDSMANKKRTDVVRVGVFGLLDEQGLLSNDHYTAKVTKLGQAIDDFVQQRARHFFANGSMVQGQWLTVDVSRTKVFIEKRLLASSGFGKNTPQPSMSKQTVVYAIWTVLALVLIRLLVQRFVVVVQQGKLDVLVSFLNRLHQYSRRRLTDLCRHLHSHHSKSFCVNGYIARLLRSVDFQIGKIFSFFYQQPNYCEVCGQTTRINWGNAYTILCEQHAEQLIR